MDIRTHNGLLTIENPKTGRHRVFQIRTQPEKARWMPGKRVLYLVSGRGHGEKTAFAFVTSKGIYLWKRFRDDEDFVKYVDLIDRPGKYKSRVVYLFESKCRRCNRPLTDPESIRLGIGPKCGEKSGGQDGRR